MILVMCLAFPGPNQNQKVTFKLLDYMISNTDAK